MILVDSSVWIDFLRGIATPQSLHLRDLLDKERLATADLVLAEVLQGSRGERDFSFVLQWMSTLPVVVIGSQDVAIEAARNHRRLRERGITVRKTIDTLIATRCIMDGFELLYSDRDFDPFVTHLGLKSAMAD
jgi:predicted nucleic acid-binding protein